MASASPSACPSSFEVVLRLSTPFGPCVGVSIPSPPGLDDTALARLDPQEVAFALAASPGRARSFVAGRLALREAFAAASLPPPPALLPQASGAPTLPPGTWGSISHKAHLAVAIAAAAPAQRGGLGVDLEHATPGHVNIAARVLGAAERAAIAHLPALAQAQQTRMAFSLKEAIYKAAHPVVQQFFGFQAAEIDLPIDVSRNNFVTVTARLLWPPLSAKTTIEVAIFSTTEYVISIAHALGNL